MDLRTADVPWTIKPLPSWTLAADAVCDVVILGSGISRALAAYHLTRPGQPPRRVMMLDKRLVSAGSIGASTALLQYEMDTTLVDLAARIGRRRATRAYRLCLDAINQFDAIVKDVGDDCGYRRRSSLYLSGPDAGPADLQAECHARRAAGIHVDYLDRGRLRIDYGIDHAAALRSADAAEVDPVRLTRRLLETALTRGLVIHDRTRVAAYEPSAGGVTLTVDTGHTVRATDVVFCTGYETEDFLKQPEVTLKTTFAVMSEPVRSFDGWRDRCLIWEAATPYFYCRTTADNRILIGGEDEATIDPAARDAMLPAKTATLVARFRAMFPKIPFTPAKSWAGTFAASPDGLPYIGRHPKFPHGYFCLGYGGNGITFAQIAARLLADEMNNRPNPDATLFAFDRDQPARPLVTSG